MKTHFRDSDPSSTGGNKVVRTAVAASLVGLMALAGCSGDNAGYRDGTISTPTTAPAPEIATPKEVMLKESIRKQKDQFAHDILALANSADPRFLVKTTHNSNKEGLTPEQGGYPEATTVVSVKTGKLVGDGDYGEYSLIVNGKLDAEGKNVDPNNAESIMVTMDLRKNNEEVRSAGGFFSFEITEVAGMNGEWHVVHRAETKGEPEYGFYITEGSDNERAPDHIEKLSPQRFNQLDQQAQIVFGWAKDAQPINYAPQIN